MFRYSQIILRRLNIIEIENLSIPVPVKKGKPFVLHDIIIKCPQMSPSLRFLDGSLSTESNLKWSEKGKKENYCCKHRHYFSWESKKTFKKIQLLCKGKL